VAVTFSSLADPPKREKSRGNNNLQGMNEKEGVEQKANTFSEELEYTDMAMERRERAFIRDGLEDGDCSIYA
jgi:hypothetical protein